MITAGKTGKAKYWGKYIVRKVIQLKEPVRCSSQSIGEAEFSPVLVKLEWEKAPSEDKNEFWFPYWIKINGKQKYGQFAPMIGEKALLELLSGAIQEDYFSKDFLTKLGQMITVKLAEQTNS
jgi:hypothetical protein